MVKSASSNLRDPDRRRRGRIESLCEQFLTELIEGKGLAQSTRAAYRRDLNRYAYYLQSIEINTPQDINRCHAEAHTEHLRSGGLGDSSVARSCSVIRQFHRFLVDCRVCDHDPTTGLDAVAVQRSAPPHILKMTDVRRLIDVVAGEDPMALRDRAILELLYAAGLRAGEIIALECRDLDVCERAVRIRGEGARGRRLPIGKPAADWLERYYREKRPELATDESGDVFFLTKRGRPLSRMSLWKTIRQAATRAGIEQRVSAHTLRHACASHLLAGGFDIRSLQILLGHEALSSTEVYSSAVAETSPGDVDLSAVHRAFHPRGS